MDIVNVDREKTSVLTAIGLLQDALGDKLKNINRVAEFTELSRRFELYADAHFNFAKMD